MKDETTALEVHACLCGSQMIEFEHDAIEAGNEGLSHAVCRRCGARGPKARSGPHVIWVWNRYASGEPFPAVEASEAEVGRLRDKLESDRAIVCDGLHEIGDAIKSVEWLRLGRGSYEWDDDRWKDEFGTAIDAIFVSLDPLRRVAGDWTDCSRDPRDIKRAREYPEVQVRNLKAQCESLRSALGEYLDWHEANFLLPSGNFEDPDQQSLARTARQALAQTPEQSLEGFRDDALREAHQSLGKFADNLAKRDDFLVEKRMWGEFTEWLQTHPIRALKTGEG